MISNITFILQLNSTMESYESLTALPKVLNGCAINREEAHSGTILWTHVGDSGTVSQGKLLHSWPKEFDKLSHHTNLTKVLKEK